VGTPSPITFHWVTTSPNPRNRSTGHDAGQRGWKLHAVPMKEDEPYANYKRRAALCGLSPRHGWSVDLFIEDKCVRCQSAMTKRSGEVFVDLEINAKAKHDAQQRQLLTGSGDEI